MTTADWIKRRRELLDAASPGPWASVHNSVGAVAKSCTCGAGGVYGHEQYCGLEGPVVTGCAPEDGALIADARTSLPRALDALEAVLALHSQSSYLIYCRADGEEYPCPTVDAIDTALAGGCRECRQVDGHHKLGCGRRTT